MKRILPRLCLAAMIFGMAWISVAQDQDEVKLPEGAGKKQVETICSNCHDLEGFIHNRHSRRQWETVVDEMISRGAEGTDEDFDLIVEYLSKYLGLLNLNKATADELATGLAISKDIAAAMVAYREKNGPFKTWQDLAKVPGLDMKKIQDKKGTVEF